VLSITSCQRAGTRFDRGQPRELRELVDQVLERLDLLHDRPACTRDDPLEVGRRLQVRLADALRRELDRRERVLDLVGQLARHLAPGGDLLRAHERREVVEHHERSRAAAPGAPAAAPRRTASWRSRPAGITDLALLARRAAREQALHQLDDLLAARARAARPSSGGRRGSGRARAAAAPPGWAVVACLGVDEQHAGADRLEHGLLQPAPLLQLLVLAREARRLCSTSSSLRARRSDIRLKEAISAANSSVPAGSPTRTPRSPDAMRSAPSATRRSGAVMRLRPGTATSHTAPNRIASAGNRKIDR
jgi:hypothetical protein